MRFPLDIGESLEDSLLFWITRYVLYKKTNLSDANVTDQKLLEECDIKLNNSPETIEEIEQIVKDIADSGMKGIKSFFVPVKKLHIYLKRRKLTSMKEISEDIVKQFLSSSTAGMKKNTKKNYKNAMTNFFGYISKHNENTPNSGNGYIYNLELSTWKRQQLQNRDELPAFLEEKEVHTLLGNISGNGELPYEFTSERMYLFYNLFVRVALFGGTRIAEALGIKRKKITRKDGLLKFPVVGKGDKIRVIEISEALLQPYLDEWLYSTRCTDDLLFCSPDGRKKGADETLANSESVSHKIRDILEHSGIKKVKMGAHLFRHTYATTIYRITKDQRLLQELLGHSSSASTLVYTHIERERVSQAARMLDAAMQGKKSEEENPPEQ
ncbi:MAG: tyrosine-type recombinase/integrase [Epsilonproteobacteria bacterium]|nr:tyrosine-type recombinase/integrase [Campylobacterota bacterium]